MTINKTTAFAVDGDEAHLDSAPRDMAPEQNLLRISSADSTWSRGSGLRPRLSGGTNCSVSRKVVGGRLVTLASYWSYRS